MLTRHQNIGEVADFINGKRTSPLEARFTI